MKVRKVEDIEISGLGDRIKKAREAHKSSLVQLAKVAKIDRSYWYDIEAERLSYPLPIETLRKIENVLGVKFLPSEERRSEKNKN